MNFLIMALPRSRTAWLANFLTYGDSFCFHEPLLGLNRVADIAAKVRTVKSSVIGGADTGAVFFLDQLTEMYPTMRLVVIDRPVLTCYASMQTMGFDINVSALHKVEKKLEAVKARYNPLVVKYYDLHKQPVMEELWRFCVDSEFPVERWKLLQHMNVQVEKKQFFEQLRQQEEAIKNIAREAAL